MAAECVTSEIKQRHFHAQKYAVTDGLMQFDIATTVGRSIAGIKQVPAWLPALHQVLNDGTRSGANVEFALAARFPHLDKSVTQRPTFVDKLASCQRPLKSFVQS